MANLSDTPNVPISCPKCGKVMDKEFTRVDSDPHLTCTDCGHKFEVNDEEIRKIERTFDDSSEDIKEDPELPK